MKLKSVFNSLAIIFIIAVFSLIIIAGFHTSKINKELNNNYDSALNNFDPQISQNQLQSGYAKSGIRKLHQKKVQRLISKRKQKDLPRLWWVNGKDQHAQALTAMGIDKKHHFANSYLIGFKPFDTDRHWVPLYMLASKKLYQYDHLQYSGLKDVWQNSLQAFKNTRGDCEDHAIALADWLIGLGLDARVAIGDISESGHAWVIVFKDGKEYLLEATRKSRVRQWSKYRLAKTETDYHPTQLFNRNTLWINTGSKYTTSYSGNNWKQASTFHKDPAI